MAKVFIESYDMESLDQWTSTTDAAVISDSLGGGDFAVELDATTGELVKTFSSSLDEVYYGFFSFHEETNDATKKIVAWKSGGATELGRLSFNASTRKVEAYTGTGGGSTLRGTSTSVWSDDSAHHIQIRIKIGNGGSGRLQVKIDNILEIDFSGDTQPGSETDIDTWQHLAGAGSSIYAAHNMHSTSGTTFNSWPLVARMRGRVTSTEGALDQWDTDPVVADASDNLDESGPPDPADIISSGVNGNRQSLRFPSHGFIGAAVKGVHYFYHMRKVSDGQGKHGLRRRTDSTIAMDASARTLSTSFKTEVFSYAKNPITTLDFTLTQAQDDHFESVMEAVV